MHRPKMDVVSERSRSESYPPGWERTVVARPLAIGMCVAFGIGLLAVPAIDAWQGSWRVPAESARAGFVAVVKTLSEDSPWWQRLVGANRAALAGIKTFETAMEDSSAVAAFVRPATLDALLRFGGAGSEEAYVGHDGWLFYRPDVDALMRSGGVARQAPAAIARFAADLAARGIRLVFLPVPGKASIHPERLGVGIGFERPLLPARWETLEKDVLLAWEQEIADRGLADAPAPMVFDPSNLLWERRSASGNQFLAMDSHWTPGAMEAVAARVAGLLDQEGDAPPGTEPPQVAVSSLGDTARMLDLPSNSPLRREQEVAIRPLKWAGGEVWAPDSSAEVLVLGDSYTNIYSEKDLGWGESAGLAEQLSRFLGKSVDRLSRNDAGAAEARRMIVSAAARDPAWIQGKKVVVWQLAARELVTGDWTAVAWEGGRNIRGGFFIAPPGRSVEVTAEIAALGPVPRLGASPYADYLTAVHLTDLRDAAGGGALDGDALVYVFTMRDHRILPAAGLSPGQRVRMRLSNYGEKAGTLDAMNRGELEDVDVMLETPNFAEWLPSSEP
jgi:hypothetical protein